MRRAPARDVPVPMKAWARRAGACLLAGLSIGCSAATRYRVLTIFFDGVPPPGAARAAEATRPGAATGPAPPRPVVFREHGPYAARLCNACHESAATNALILPREELCFRCHELRLDRKYIHGPIASGGCLVCHDPHSSQYRALLVSDSDSFCFHCHERASIAAIAGHEGVEGGCTDCHDAHASDTKYLLK